MADIKTAPPARRSRNDGEPPWAVVVDDEPASPPTKAVGSRWLIPAYIPWLNWMTWLYLGAKTRHQLYYWFGALYLAPFFILLAIIAPQTTANQDLPDWLTAMGVVSWIGGLIHLFAMKKEINLRLQYVTATGQADVNLWPPAWRIWSYIPGIHWATWIHAAIRSKYVPYYFLAAVYALPFGLYIAFSKQTPDGGTDGPAWALTLVIVSWIACIIHATLLTSDVNARIDHAPHGGQVDLDLEQRIRQEYEVKLPPPAVPQAPGTFADPFAVNTFATAESVQTASQSGTASVLWTLVPTREKVVKALKAKLEQKAMDWIWEGAKWAGGFSLSIIMVWVKNKVG